jgi:hypothetical protein
MKRYTALSGPVLSFSRRLGAVVALAMVGACSSSAGGSSSGGGGAPVSAASASCWGTPTDCASQTPIPCVNGCNLILGTYPMPDLCDGSPNPCDQLGVEDLCAQAGCQWGTPGHPVIDAGVAPASNCQGTPVACAGFGEFECANGCTWIETCTPVDEAGTAFCDVASDYCDEQPGCRSSGSCTGTPWPCKFGYDESSCAAIQGCSWP